MLRLFHWLCHVIIQRKQLCGHANGGPTFSSQLHIPKSLYLRNFQKVLKHIYLYLLILLTRESCTLPGPFTLHMALFFILVFCRSQTWRRRGNRFHFWGVLCIILCVVGVRINIEDISNIEAYNLLDRCSLLHCGLG
jgi:hypothetical protein